MYVKKAGEKSCLFYWLNIHFANNIFVGNNNIMATLTTEIPTFKITFDIFNQVMDFEDTFTTGYADYGTLSSTVGLIKITHISSASTILYQNEGWDEVTPDFSAPDINGGDSPKWKEEDIDLPTDPNGDYQIDYILSTDGGTTFVQVTRCYTLKYTQPVVSIALTALCSTSQLMSEDTSDYNVVIDGVQFTPTISRSHKITAPAGSGATDPGAVIDTGTTPLRTIGGGNTNATRLWTRIWQTNIVTSLAYTLSEWSTDLNGNPQVILTDTVKGDDNINVQCDATICALAACYNNMLNRWRASITSNFSYMENYRDKVIEANGLWAQLQLYERCGVDTESTILALQELLSGEDCNCTTNSDEASVPIVPWAAIVSGNGTASAFSFTVSTSNPSSDEVGTDGDMWLNKTAWYLFQKENGHWIALGCIKGAAGENGEISDQSVQFLTSDQTVNATGANTSATVLKTDTIVSTEFLHYGDYKEFIFEVLLSHSGNGKLIELDYGGTKIFSFFTDELITADNDRLTIKLKVIAGYSYTVQHLIVALERKGFPGYTTGPTIIRDHTLDLYSAKLVRLIATNSVAIASEITCDSVMSFLYHRVVSGLPELPPAEDGRGLMSQSFTATEGQTVFDVTLFLCNNFYLAFIDGANVSQSVVTRVGNRFTVPALHEGQVLTIVD